MARIGKKVADPWSTLMWMYEQSIPI